MAITARKSDPLSLQRNKLNRYVSQFNSAVSIITGTIDSLSHINDGIDSTMQEIESYQRELETTRSGLADAKAKNERVIANFGALLQMDE